MSLCSRRRARESTVCRVIANVLRKVGDTRSGEIGKRGRGRGRNGQQQPPPLQEIPFPQALMEIQRGFPTTRTGQGTMAYVSSCLYRLSADVPDIRCCLPVLVRLSIPLRPRALDQLAVSRRDDRRRHVRQSSPQVLLRCSVGPPPLLNCRRAQPLRLRRRPL